MQGWRWVDTTNYWKKKNQQRHEITNNKEKEKPSQNTADERDEESDSPEIVACSKNILPCMMTTWNSSVIYNETNRSINKRCEDARP